MESEEIMIQPNWHWAEGRWYHVCLADGDVYVDGELTARSDGGCVCSSRALPAKIIEIVCKIVRRFF